MCIRVVRSLSTVTWTVTFIGFGIKIQPILDQHMWTQKRDNLKTYMLLFFIYIYKSTHDGISIDHLQNENCRKFQPNSLQSTCSLVQNPVLLHPELILIPFQMSHFTSRRITWIQIGEKWGFLLWCIKNNSKLHYKSTDVLHLLSEFIQSEYPIAFVRIISLPVWFLLSSIVSFP